MTLLYRTPLTRDFTESMVENAYMKFMEDYAASVNYLKFNAATASDAVYDEAIAKTYEAPVVLLAKARLKPSAKYLQEAGILEKVDAIFIFSQKQLTDSSVTISHKDKIVFKGTEYHVADAGPLGQIKDMNFFVHVACVDTPEDA